MIFVQSRKKQGGRPGAAVVVGVEYCRMYCKRTRVFYVEDGELQSLFDFCAVGTHHRRTMVNDLDT